MSFQQKEFLIDRITETLRHDIPEYSQNRPVVHALEAEFCLYHLQLILQNSQPTQTQSALKNFLRNRWNYLRDTNLQYLHDFESPANQICIVIAKILHELTGHATLSLLMPSLKQVTPDSYITSSYLDEDLDLRHLILSDDNSRLIHIIDTLDYAINDGVLKHTALFNKKSHYLSVSETKRLLSRHPSVRDFYEALETKVQFELHGETLGANLKRLIKGLEEGNVDHHGSETDAGEDANLAIIEFAATLETLSREKRQLLLRAKKLFETNSISRSREYSVQDAWHRLQRRHKHSASNVGVICVKLIGNDLNDILLDNPELYTIPTFDSPDEGTSLVAIKEQVSILRESMMLSLAELQFHRTYEMQDSSKLYRYLCEKLLKNPEFILKPSYIAWIFETSKISTNTYVLGNSALIIDRLTTSYSEAILRQTQGYLPGALVDEFRRLVLCKRSLPMVQSQSIFHKKAKHAMESEAKYFTPF
jgi:hypothetical protein